MQLLVFLNVYLGCMIPGSTQEVSNRWNLSSRFWRIAPAERCKPRTLKSCATQDPQTLAGSFIRVFKVGASTTEWLPLNMEGYEG